VRDQAGEESDWLVRSAEDEEALRQQIRKLGHEILAIEPYDFQEWLDRAAGEACKAVEARQRGDKIEFRSALWAELKQYLFFQFHGKCAYCESQCLHVTYGDVEHYRPKRQVSEAPDHPGYWWLAYVPTNLLPCCERCNRHRGKMNHFPVHDNAWARCPESLPEERPLLLHPGHDDPQGHFEWVPPLDPEAPISVVRGISEEGKTSIEIYNLNRGELPTIRGAALLQLQRDLGLAVANGTAGALYQKILSGETAYSAALAAEIESLLEELTGRWSRARSEDRPPSRMPPPIRDARSSAEKR
jgi:5-methylcytosine-specific restriction endonuclease McrA